jgi:hypothetical protein
MIIKSCFANLAAQRMLERYDVRGSSTPEEYAERVHQMARSVWVVWDEYHEWVRQWLKGK